MASVDELAIGFGNKIVSVASQQHPYVDYQMRMNIKSGQPMHMLIFNQ
jgi:hypothetical protein